MSDRDMPLERIDLPDYFKDERRLDDLKRILYIHDHYSARLVATATGSSGDEAHKVLLQLCDLGVLSPVWVVADIRRRGSPYQILFLKLPPVFPLVYISPSSGKRVRLRQEHANVQLEFERVKERAS